MKIIFDAHIHSYLSRATSRDTNLETLAEGARKKGISILGSGDFTHPIWFDELRKKLVELEGKELFEYKNMTWMLTSEVSTVYEQDKKVRKVHHIIHSPSLEIVDQINSELKGFGDLKSDGRPMLSLTSPELVEILMSISKKIFVYPAHAWTPWFAVFGSTSGFDSLKDCYQDQVKHIHALETGLSSDPPMNWRLSQLDDICLLSNSDSHSHHTWRLGREANVFDLKEISYEEIHEAILKKDSKRFIFTIETDPAYGKYHFTGHRNCNVVLHPKDSIKLNDMCPNCGRKLTVGVLQRLESLTDREESFRPKKFIPFKSLLPLYEIISFVWGVNRLYSKKVIEEQDKLIENFGNEFNVLLNVKKEDLIKFTSEKIADAIIKIREGKVRFYPGYDGIYGKPIFNSENFEIRKSDQRSLKEF